MSKARIYSAWCPNRSDRLVHVVRIQGRPLALTRTIRAAVTMSPNPELDGRRSFGKRNSWKAMWLDLDLSPDRGGVGWQLNATCAHERLSIPADWLRRDVEAGTRNRVIDDEVRRQIGAARLGRHT